MFQLGSIVASTEHPKSIGKVIRVNEDGDLTIEFTTPASDSLPYGHIVTEFWPVAELSNLTELA